jgi:hypothetical protein
MKLTLDVMKVYFDGHERNGKVTCENDLPEFFVDMWLK